MKKPKHLKRLARTLIEAAGMDTAPKALAELRALNDAISKSKELRSVLVGPQFTAAEKQAVVNGLGLSEVSRKFVAYLSEQNAMLAFGLVLDAAHALYLERKRTSRAKVITPAPIGREYEERLRESLRRLTGREVEIEYETDPALIGGMLVKVGSSMYDGSIRGQLRLLKDEIIKG